MAMHTYANKSAQNLARLNTHIAPATEKDVSKIIDIINKEAKLSGAVLPVNETEVTSWIKNGLSFVVKTTAGEIIGHHSAYIWPESKWIELRAAIVAPEYRGNGINKELKKSVMDAILKKYPNATIVSVKNKASNGRTLLEELGFKKIPQSEAPKELFEIGPKNEEYDIYVLNPRINSELSVLARA